MDGENNGKPYEQMDDLGVPLFWKHPYLLFFLEIYSAMVFSRKAEKPSKSQKQSWNQYWKVGERITVTDAVLNDFMKNAES